MSGYHFTSGTHNKEEKSAEALFIPPVNPCLVYVFPPRSVHTDTLIRYFSI